MYNGFCRCGYVEKKVKDFMWRIQVYTMCEIANFCKWSSYISTFIKLMLLVIAIM
jgi:hypothetical protein